MLEEKEVIYTIENFILWLTHCNGSINESHELYDKLDEYIEGYYE